MLRPSSVLLLLCCTPLALAADCDDDTCQDISLLQRKAVRRSIDMDSDASFAISTANATAKYIPSYKSSYLVKNLPVLNIGDVGSLQLAGSFTAMGWIFREGQDDVNHYPVFACETVVSAKDECLVLDVFGGKLLMSFFQDDCAGVTPISPGTWHHSLSV